MKEKYIGLHIIADLYNCDFVLLKKIKLGNLRSKVSTIIKENGLHELGNFYKEFSEGAYSGIISLTESHLAFHSWPEIDYISLDIFVCNYQRDDTKKAMSLYKDMLKLFSPKKIRTKF